LSLDSSQFGQDLLNSSNLGGFSSFVDGVQVDPNIVNDPATQHWLQNMRRYYPQAQFVMNGGGGEAANTSYQLSLGGAAAPSAGTNDTSKLPVNPATGHTGFGGAMDLLSIPNTGSSGDVRWNRNAAINSGVYGPEVNRNYVQFDNNRFSQMAGPLFSSLLLGGLGAMYGLPAGLSSAMSGMGQLQNIGNGGSFNPLSALSMLGQFIPGYSQIAPYVGLARTAYGLSQGGNPITGGLSAARTLGNLMGGGSGNG
jgi:hypothetical protein